MSDEQQDDLALLSSLENRCAILEDHIATLVRVIKPFADVMAKDGVPRSPPSIIAWAHAKAAFEQFSEYY